MRRGLLLLCSSLLLTPNACSSEDEAPPSNAAGTGGSGAADAAPESGGSGGSAGSAGSAGYGGDAGPSACALCGKDRPSGPCKAALDACLADPECKAIHDCVNMGRACALDEKGAKCVEVCIADSCPSLESQQRFLALDACNYCDMACRASCDVYCGAFDMDGGSPLCSDAGLDGGDDAEAGADGGDAEAGADGGDAEADSGSSDAEAGISDAAADVSTD